MPASRLSIAIAVADASRDGVILCDAGGRVLHRNSVAVDMLDDAHAPEQILETLTAFGVYAIETGKATATRLNGWEVSTSAVAAVSVITIRPHEHLPSEESLRARYRLSRREAQVALLLADRRTDAEIAAELGISWHTVRSHVEGIFAALHCHSRRDAATKLKSPEPHTDQPEDNYNE